MPSVTIDYGAAITRAIIMRADGSLQPLELDGSFELSSAVHVRDGQIAVGAQAWQHAATDPDGFVLSPLHTASGQELTDLVAATLRHVAVEATRVLGETVEQAHLLVPAGWGPQRRTWLRQAARNAGLLAATVTAVPVAAAPRLSPDTARVLLIIDIGAGCEATVLQQTPHGAEILSTLNDPAAGGDRIDTLLATALTGTSLDDLPTGQRWTTLAVIRTAEQALAYQPAVTMPIPGQPNPLIVGGIQVAQAAEPVLERAGQLAAEAVTAAGLTLADIHGVHLIGGAAVLPGAAGMIAAKLGVEPLIPDQPAAAALLGAAESDPAGRAAREADAGVPLRLPPARRIAFLGAPVAAGLLLYVLYLTGAEINGSTPFDSLPGPGYSVLAAWPELTLAAVLVQIGLLQAAGVFAALLDQSQHIPGRAGSPSRIAAGLAIAVATGLVIAYVFAAFATAYFSAARTVYENIPYRYAIAPLIPIAVCAAIAAALAWRRRAPAEGWDGFLAFPATSMITATAGIILTTVPAVLGMPWWLSGWSDAMSYGGTLLLAAGIAIAMARHVVIRVALAMIIAVPLIPIEQTWWGYWRLGLYYTAAVIVWWIKKLWILYVGSR